TLWHINSTCLLFHRFLLLILILLWLILLLSLRLIFLGSCLTFSRYFLLYFFLINFSCFCLLLFCLLTSNNVNFHTEFILKVTKRPICAPTKYTINFSIIKSNML